MTAATLRKTFVNAVTSMAQETNAKKAKKTYLKTMLAIHPDKQRNASTKNVASTLSQKLSGIYSMIESNAVPRSVRSNLSNPRFVANLAHNKSPYDPSTSSSSSENYSNSSNSNDPNWMPGAHSNNNNFTPGNYGSRYRPNRTYDARDRTRQRHSGDPVSNAVYKHIQITNPVLFRRHVLNKIPKQYKPCPPGTPPPHHTCQSRIRPMVVSMKTAVSQYRKYGSDQYWVGTEHGRRAVAHAISLIPNRSLQKSLKRKALLLGFDVDKELKRKRT